MDRREVAQDLRQFGAAELTGSTGAVRQRSQPDPGTRIARGRRHISLTSFEGSCPDRTRHAGDSGGTRLPACTRDRPHAGRHGLREPEALPLDRGPLWIPMGHGTLARRPGGRWPAVDHRPQMARAVGPGRGSRRRRDAGAHRRMVASSDSQLTSPSSSRTWGPCSPPCPQESPGSREQKGGSGKVRACSQLPAPWTGA